MEILKLLADGQFHSGVQLAQALGVSRTTISKRIAQWTEQGLMIDSVMGKGYRLVHPIDWLSEDKIRALLEEGVTQHITSLMILPNVSSTNDIVAEALQQRKCSGVVCVAEMQQAGRGRRGRIWCSPPAGNFYGSIGWIYREGFAVLEGLSLAIGVAVIQALESLGAQGLSLKWPNDILWQGQKLGGVLIEMTGEADGPCQVVVGVGINLHLPAYMKQHIEQAAVDLATVCDVVPARTQVTATIISTVVRLLASYSQQGFAAWHQPWLTYDAFANQQVTIQGIQPPVAGIARGVDVHGALLIEQHGQMVAIHGGEVSLRKVEV